MIITIKNITLGGSNKFQDTIFEKEAKLFEFQMVGSKQFHSMTQKERVLEEFVSRVKKEKLSTFLVAYAWGFSGINLKR